MQVRFMAAVVAIAVLILVGCGGSGSSRSSASTTVGRQSPEVALAEAARRTLAEGTARYSLDLLTNVQGLASSTAKGIGAIDFKKSCSQLDMTFEASGQKLAFSVIYDHGILYEKLPPELGGTPSKPWIKLDLSDVLGGKGGAGAQFNPNEPGGIVALIYGAGGVTEAGTETVRGVRATHYKGSLDPKRAAERLPPEYKERYMDSLHAIGAAGPMPAEHWVDDHGLIRRIQLSGKATVQGKQSTTRTTIEYFDFGTPVDIKLPPASQIQ